MAAAPVVFDYPGIGIRRTTTPVYTAPHPALPDHRVVAFTFLHMAHAPNADVRFQQLGNVIQNYYAGAPIANYGFRFYDLNNAAPPLRNTSLHNIGPPFDLGTFLANFYARMLDSGSVGDVVGFTVAVQNVGPHIPYLNAGGWGLVKGWSEIPKTLKGMGLCEHPCIKDLPDEERASWCGFRAIALAHWMIAAPDMPPDSVDELQRHAKQLAGCIGRHDGFMQIVDISRLIKVDQLQFYRIVIFNAWRRVQHAAQGNHWFWDENTLRTDQDSQTIHLYWDHQGKHYYWIQSMKPFFGRYASIGDEYVRCMACFDNVARVTLSTHDCIGVGSFQCPICLDHFGCGESLQTHLSLRNTDYPACEVCERNVFNGEGCFRHHLTHNCEPKDFLPAGVEKVICEVCGWNHRTDRKHNCIGEHGCCRYCKIRFDHKDQRVWHRCEIHRNEKFWTPLETKEKNGKVTSFLWRSHYFYDFETTKTNPLSNNSYQLGVMAWCIRLLVPDALTADYIKRENICERLMERARNLQLEDVHTEGAFRATKEGDPTAGVHSVRFLGKTIQSFIAVVENVLTNKSTKMRWTPTLWAHNGSKFDAKFIFDYYVNEVRLDLAGITYNFEFGENGEPARDPDDNLVWKAPKAVRSKKAVIQLSNVGSRILSLKVFQSIFRCSLAHHAMPLRNLPKVFGIQHQVRKGEFPYSRLSPDRWNDRPLGTGMPPLQEFETESMSASRRHDVIQWWVEECVKRWAKPSFIRECLDAVQFPDEDSRVEMPADYPASFEAKRGNRPPCRIVRGWKFSDELWAYLKDDVDVGALCLEAYHRAAEEMHQRIWEVTTNFELKERKAIVSPLDCSTAPSWAFRLYTTWFMPANQLFILKPHETRFVRQALRGGRTDKRANWVEVTPERKAAGDKLVYVDFKSLYPSVQKCDAHTDFPTHFPVGTPRFQNWEYLGPMNNQQIKDHVGDSTGFLQVTTRPKRFVTHPTLHRLRKLSPDEKAGLVDADDSEKLVFANEPLSKEVYAWPELLEAIESDEIEVEKLHYALLFDKGQDVFDEYVKFFFELKETAEQTGNKGLRALAKLLLNSLWGKLGQKSYPIREWVTCHERLDYLWKKFELGDFEIVNFHQNEPLRAWIEYTINNDVTNASATAPHIAAFVSTWGRVMLHRKLLRQHGQRALYCDTDSSIVYLRAGDELPFTGSGLGCLTMEVPKILEDAGYDLKTYPDPYIKEAVFVAPKTYALRICHDDPPLVYHKVVCKGFEPSFNNAKELHFQSMKELVWTRNHLKAYVNGKRDLEPDETDMQVRTYIRDRGRLQFASSMATNRVAPIQRTMTKQLTGVYTKGKTISWEPRLVQPYGIFAPARETFLDFVNNTKHYD